MYELVELLDDVQEKLLPLVATQSEKSVSEPVLYFCRSPWGLCRPVTAELIAGFAVDHPAKVTPGGGGGI